VRVAGGRRLKWGALSSTASSCSNDRLPCVPGRCVDDTTQGLRAFVWRLLAAMACAGVLALAMVPAPAEGLRRGGRTAPLYDRTFKCDRLERLPEPPELVVLGGSRAQRFEPSQIERRTGLPAFNFAVQNSRPEDAYAIARYLFRRAPDVKLRCIWAVQVTTLGDTPLHPGLLAEDRLARFLPDGLVAAQRAAGARVAAREVRWSDEYSPRGALFRNGYDRVEARGVGLGEVMQDYLARMLPKAAAPSPHEQRRSKRYFEKTLRLFNLHGVAPVLVIMPYHPEALAAFRAVGWQHKLDALNAYLRGLRGRYVFRLLDYTEIGSFGGSARGFYDGAHVKRANARRIVKQIVADVPGAFR
jgi:hypothetical protein